MKKSVKQAAHTTEFIVKGNDYFTAYTDKGGVRIGLVNCASIDFPRSHKLFDEIVALVDENSVEYKFDMLVDEYNLI